MVPATDHVALSLENHHDARVALRTGSTIERRSESGWEAVVTLWLRDDCESQPAEDSCQGLVPGAEYHPLAWKLHAQEAQCGCSDCTTVPAGTFRWTVRDCEGAYQVHSEPWELGGAGAE